MPDTPSTAMLALLVATSTASAVLTEPFTSWGELTRKSSDIVIARCVSPTEEKNRLEAGLRKSDGGQASTSVNPARRPQLAPYEIVLDGEHVMFVNPESVSIQITMRDLGVKKMIAPDLYWGLSVLWDGKEYKRDPKYIGSWNGPWEILPRTAWRTGFSLSEYLVPAKALTAGRHTIALKDAFAESNTLTVFLEKSGTDQAYWGELVEGVSVRMHADKVRWTTNETPTFKVDVRNQGQRRFYTFQAQESGRLQVDGVWYDWASGSDLKGSFLPPGQEYDDTPVSLGNNWNATQEWRDKSQAPLPQIPLELLPGKHTIRFAPEIRDLTVKPKPENIYVPSNPVEIEIMDESRASERLPKAETDSAIKKFSVSASAAASASNADQIEMTINIRNLSDKPAEIMTIEGQQPFSVRMHDARGGFIERDRNPLGKDRTQKQSRLRFMPGETKTYRTPLPTIKDAKGKDVGVPVGIYLVEAVFPVVYYVDGKYVVELIRSAPVKVEINSKRSSARPPESHWSQSASTSPGL
jgi:hypothetical protein